MHYNPIPWYKWLEFAAFVIASAYVAWHIFQFLIKIQNDDQNTYRPR